MRLVVVSAPIVAGVALSCGKTPGNSAGATVGATGAASTATTVSAIQQKIGDDPALAGARITAKLATDTVDLEGTVRSAAQKDRAEAIVYAVQADEHEQTGVTDNLMVAETPAAGEGGSSRGGH